MKEFHILLFSPFSAIFVICQFRNNKHFKLPKNWLGQWPSDFTIFTRRTHGVRQCALDMASLCTVIPATLFPQPMAVPAKNPNVHGTILRARRLLIPTKTFSRALNATQPQKYIYPEPISEFAAAVSQKLLKIVFLNCK